jgi:hypothetical protein
MKAAAFVCKKLQNDLLYKIVDKLLRPIHPGPLGRSNHGETDGPSKPAEKLAPGQIVPRFRAGPNQLRYFKRRL